jgi:anti-anti-sigma factor
VGTPLSLNSDRRDDGTRVLVAAGEVDLSNVDTLNQALSGVIGDGGTVTVDLSAVEYLDSAAINAFFSYVEHIDIVANPVLIPVLTVSGLADVVRVRPSA